MNLFTKGRDHWRHFKAIAHTDDQLNEFAKGLNSDDYDPDPGVIPTLETADEILDY